MELCTTRHLLLSLFILQLIIVSIRQTFDFLGYMWASVLANFLYTLFIIFGIFGVVQCRSVYTFSYTICTLFWLIWNIFVVCIYIDLFGSNKVRRVLSFGTDSGGWWEVNGPGCKEGFLSNLTTFEEDPYQPIKPDYVVGCIIDFRYVEVTQAAVHAIIAMWGCIIGIKVSHAFITQKECSERTKKNQNGVLPLYSIEYSPRRPEEMYGDDESSHSPEDSDNRGNILGGSRPMTPRRVKRRSVNSKNTLPPQYQQRQETQQPPPYICRPIPYGSTRSSARSSTRKQRNSLHNPVSKFLEQQQLSFHHQMLNDSSTSNDSCRAPFTSSQSQLLSPSDLINNSASNIGHTNPNFVSNTSLDRPPSARSSYSNYHGVRTLAFNKQATPQVPSNSCRRNTRSAYSTFFNDGPPAYEIQGAVSSETVI